MASGWSEDAVTIISVWGAKAACGARPRGVRLARLRAHRVAVARRARPSGRKGVAMKTMKGGARKGAWRPPIGKHAMSGAERQRRYLDRLLKSGPRATDLELT